MRRIATETGAGQWGFVGWVCLPALRPRVHHLHGESPATIRNPTGARSCIFGARRSSLRHRPHAGRTRHPESRSGNARQASVLHFRSRRGCRTHNDTHYALGSVLNHVLLHQTVVGLETKRQLELAGEKPDTLIGCVGGGSNFGGFALPFLTEKLKRPDLRIVAVEPAACPSLTKGIYAYDFGDTAKLTPLVKMFTLGHTFVPEGILPAAYATTAPHPSWLTSPTSGLIESRALLQNAVFEGALQFSRAEGFVPAPETSQCHPRRDRRGTQERQQVHRLLLQRTRPTSTCRPYDAHLAGNLRGLRAPRGKDRRSAGITCPRSAERFLLVRRGAVGAQSLLRPSGPPSGAQPLDKLGALSLSNGQDCAPTRTDRRGLKHRATRRAHWGQCAPP